MPKTPKTAAPKPSKPQTIPEFLSALAVAVMQEQSIPLENEGGRYAAKEALFRLRGRTWEEARLRRIFVTVACLRQPPVRGKAIADILEMGERTPGTIFRKAKKRLTKESALRAAVTSLCIHFGITPPA
jgi:hypothetical protein